MTTAMDVMVELENLVRDFGPIRAVDKVSFRVGRGEVLGFLGPNGAGKSTTMKMLTCFIAPTSGTARVCGHDILKEPVEVRRRIGYLPEGAPAYSDMTPESFLGFAAEVRGLRGKHRRERIDAVVEQVGLNRVWRQPIETLSKGFKRRVGLAQAILHDPEVLILDEPTDGLDPNQKHEVRTLITSMAANKSIILSTHILEEVEAVCSRAIIIAAGRKIFDGTPAELEATSARHNAVRLVVDTTEAQAIIQVLSGLDDVDRVESSDAHEKGRRALLVVPHDKRPILPIIATMANDNHWKVYEMGIEAGRLDEVFRTMTSAAGRGAA